MDKVTGKEGKGVDGSGFTGPTKSNNYVALPKSSNANLGIDASVASGSSDSASSAMSKGLNVGNDNSSQGTDNMSPSKFGIGPDISTGTVRGGVEGVNEKRKPGEFGVSALSGKPSSTLNSDEYYGSGARKAGTAAAFGEPGRGGSMGLAAKGLSGSTGSGMPSQPAMGAEKSLDAAKKGIKGSGGNQ